MKNQWLQMIDGGSVYGAPAHGGQLKVTQTETIDDGKRSVFAHFEISRVNQKTNQIEVSYISIPASQLEVLIQSLKNIQNDQVWSSFLSENNLKPGAQ